MALVTAIMVDRDTATTADMRQRTTADTLPLIMARTLPATTGPGVLFAQHTLTVQGTIAAGNR